MQSSCSTCRAQIQLVSSGEKPFERDVPAFLMSNSPFQIIARGGEHVLLPITLASKIEYLRLLLCETLFFFFCGRVRVCTCICFIKAGLTHCFRQPLWIQTLIVLFIPTFVGSGRCSGQLVRIVKSFTLYVVGYKGGFQFVKQVVWIRNHLVKIQKTGRDVILYHIPDIFSYNSVIELDLTFFVRSSPQTTRLVYPVPNLCNCEQEE